MSLSPLLAFEVFDDIAFMYLAIAVLAAAVLPWSILKAGFALARALRKPELVPLTRIQKLKLAQSQQAAKAGSGASGASASAAASGGGGAVTVQPALASSDPATAASIAKSHAAASGLTQESLRPAAPWFSCGNITLLLLWVVFILLLLQIPSFSGENLASFKPYEILGVDSKATDEEIKRAYRKQSLLFHPDRNPSPEAAQSFMLIAKAYETLTSETAKANIAKYGNPDGYQGVSVTIGLPSMLTRKENEMRVLVVYFFLFIVLPPICVWVWWRKAKDFIEGGILKKTIGLWYQLMLPNMGPKSLVEFLSIAAENEVLIGPDHPTDVVEFKRLSAEIKAAASPQAKQRFQDAKTFGTYFQYSAKASTLLHAYLMRLPIRGDQMKKDVLFLLKDAHKLLATMLELALARAFVPTVFAVFDLMQLITQGLWVHDSPLMQLPYLDAEACRKLGRKNIRTVLQLLKAPQDRLAKSLPDLTADQWSEVRSTAELIPDVALVHKYSVEDEEGLFEGDLVTLSVKLERRSFDPDAPEVEHRYRAQGGEGDESSTAVTTTKSEDKDEADKDDKSASVAKGKNNKAKFAAASSTAEAGEKKGDEDHSLSASVSSATVSADVAAAAASSSSSSPSSALIAGGRPLTDDEILDSLPLPKHVPSVPDLLQSGPSVHSLVYPFPKHERWTVLLVEKSAKKSDKIIGVSKVPSFFDEASLEMRFLAPKAKSAKEDGLARDDAAAGVYNYELHAICDSYVGADVVVPFSMRVQKPLHASDSEEHAKSVRAKVLEEYSDLGQEDEHGELIEEEEYESKWYYAGFASFWELVLNAVVLGLLAVFIFNFLHSRGYWQRFISPVVDFVASYTYPVWLAVRPVFAPVLDPLGSSVGSVYEALSNALHRDPFPPTPIHPDDVVIDETAVPGMGQED